MKTNLGWTVAIGALLLGSAATLPASMIPIAGDPVRTASGAIAGTRLDSGVRAYLGIPFAAAPTGRLRWAAPQPNKWRGVWNADRKGPECIQVLRPHNINHYFGEEPSSEDCLYMNIWTPAKARPGAKLPVVVFIYGGGMTIGSSGMANYDGEQMAKAGAVFVNFNYRVGALGFLAHPELTREQGGHSGNYGIMDQQAALRWIQQNIAQFGGDPTKVLISGQSAGARGVASQIFSPLSRGLFRAAMMSSGCNFDAQTVGLADAEKIGLQMQERLKATSLDDMRQVPADRILAAQSENQVGARVEGIRVPAPIIDGYVLPAPSAKLLAAGAFNKVPIIASYNSDDNDIGQSPFPKANSVREYREIAARMYGKAADEFLRLYPVSSERDLQLVARQAARDSGLELRARQCAQLNQQYGSAPAYLSQFTRKHPYVPGLKLADQDIATVGAYHTADVPYWLGTQDKYNVLRQTRNWTPLDRTLSSRMMNALIAMARTGSPSTSSLAWPVWSQAGERKMVFGDTTGITPLDTQRLAWHSAHPLPQQAPTVSRSPRD